MAAVMSSGWLGRDGLGVVEEGGGAEHGGDDGEEAERDHQRQPGHRQIQHQLRAVEHRPQRHRASSSDPPRRPLRCLYRRQRRERKEGGGGEKRGRRWRDTRRGERGRGGGEPTIWTSARAISRRPSGGHQMTNRSDRVSDKQIIREISHK